MSVDKKIKKLKPDTDKENEQSSSSEGEEEVMDLEEDDSSEDDEDEMEDGSGGVTEMETFDFLGYPVKNCDREVVCKLLRSSMLKDSPVNVGELTDLFIRNTDLGTVLKSANDEDDEEDMDEDSPIAIIGFVHFGVDYKEPPVVQLKNWIQEKINIQSDPETREVATKSLKNNSSLLLLSARCMNLGGGLIVESLREMKKDIESGKQYVFKEVLVILNMYSAEKNNEVTSNYVFEEEKVFVENATFHFDFQLNDESRNSMEYVDQSSGKRAKGTPFRRVVGLTKKSFNDSLDLIAAEFTQ